MNGHIQIQDTKLFGRVRSCEWNSQRIRHLRLHLGMSQGEMANLLGVWQSMISEWENDRRSPRPILRTMLSLLAQQAHFPIKE